MSAMSQPPSTPTATPQDLVWRRALGWIGVDVREGEVAIAVLLFLFFFMAITFQYVSKAVRQSGFISSLSAEMLPVVWIILAVSAIPVIMLYNRAIDRFQRHNVIAGTCAVVAACVVAFSFIIYSEATWVPIAFYVFVSIAYVLIVSQFWAYSNLILNPRQGKRLFGFIGAGGLAGGAMGGYIAGLVTGIAGSRTTLLVSAGILSLTIGVVFVIQRLGIVPDHDEPGRRPADKLEAAKGGLEAILNSRHLTLIAALMFITVVVANIVDLQFSWALEEGLPADLDRTQRFDALTGGFGDLYVLMSGAAFVFQLVFTSRIHRHLGVGFAMRVLPIAMLLGTTGLFIASTLLPALLLNVSRLLKIGENGLRYSLDQATRELLFFPVPAGARLKAKAYIDVFVQRAGKAGAGILLLPVTFGLITVVQAGFVSIALIVVWLGITVALRRRYVISFRDGLRRRAVDAAVPVDLTDVTGLEVLVEGLGSSDQRQVMHSLELLEYFDKGNLVPPLLLRHESPDVRRKTVEMLAAKNRTDAIPLIEAVFSDDDPEVRSAALRALVTLHGDTAPADMVKQLDDPDVGVRCTAIASILTVGDGAGNTEARAALENMVGSANLNDRCAATDVIGELEEPAFQEDLVQLLYDPEIGVQHDAIRAVRARVERGGDNPIFVPTLISLMRDRRLKHEAREALVSYGDSVIPALVHFMNDPEEQVWVRRAIPKTVARVGGRKASDALLAQLGADDQFLRRKVIEALVWIRTHEPDLSFDADAIGAEIRHEARLYLLCLTDLVSTAPADSFEYHAPLIAWPGGKPLLLQKMFADRMRGNVDNVFGLLSLVHPGTDVRAAAISLISDDPRLRSHALEYLDNALQGEVRNAVFSVIGDLPLDDKLEHARAEFELSVQPADDVLRRLVLASATRDETAHWLGSAAIHAICELEIDGLYPQLIEASRRQDDSLVRETAVWAGNRLGLAEC